MRRTMMSNQRDKLFNKINKRYHDVKLSDGDVFTIRNLSERERTEHEIGNLNNKGQFDVRKYPETKLKMIGSCLVDSETKEQLLQESEYDKIGDLDSQVVAKLYSACLSHNGYEDDEVEELVGNSESAND